MIYKIHDVQIMIQGSEQVSRVRVLLRVGELVFICIPELLIVTGSKDLFTHLIFYVNDPFIPIGRCTIDFI